MLKRIPTWDTQAGKEPENVKGIAASAVTGRLYVTTFNRMAALDIATGNKIWDRAYPGGCDRMAIAPDGKILYFPSFEGAHWHVVNAATGDVIASGGFAVAVLPSLLPPIATVLRQWRLSTNAGLPIPESGSSWNAFRWVEQKEH